MASLLSRHGGSTVLDREEFKLDDFTHATQPNRVRETTRTKPL